MACLEEVVYIFGALFAPQYDVALPQAYPALCQARVPHGVANAPFPTDDFGNNHPYDRIHILLDSMDRDSSDR